MMAWNYFTGAITGWRTEAKIRARRVIGDHPGDAMGYVEKRLATCGMASFERRRWTYIRKLVREQLAHERERVTPLRRRQR